MVVSLLDRDRLIATAVRNGQSFAQAAAPYGITAEAARYAAIRAGFKLSPEEERTRRSERCATRFKRPLKDRFFEKVDKAEEGECWTWAGSTDRKGYPRISVDNRPVAATHVSLELDGRPRPSPAHFACHTCDNPPCTNPRHLWWGTALENTQDAVRKGRLKREGLEMGRKRLGKQAV